MDPGNGEPGALAELLRVWMIRQRVKPIDLIRATGMARNTISLILDGTTHRPKPATLQRLALAFATDPLSGEVDPSSNAEALGLLRVAAGYHDAEPDSGRSLLHLALKLRLRERARVAAWETVLERYADLGPDAVLTLSPDPERTETQ